MSMRLAIYDISAFVHTGMTVSKYATENVRGFPVGGIQYFLRSLCYHLGNNNDVIVAFDSKCDKKSVLPGYKSNRESGLAKNNVYAQLEFLYEILPSCGIPCLKADRYEADELIYTAVQNNKNKFLRLTTFSGDYDITHNVGMNVDFEPVNSKVNKVNLQNFRDAIIPSVKIMPGTISAYKAICRDTGDGIDSFLSKIPNLQLYQEFCESLANDAGGAEFVNLDYAKDLRVFAKFASTLTDRIGADKVKELITRAYVTYPRYVEGMDLTPVKFRDIDKHKFTRLLSCVADKGLTNFRTLRLQFSPMNTEEIEMMSSWGKALRTGEFAVDRNRKITNDHLAAASEGQSYLREFD